MNLAKPDLADQKKLALWAADCAERVLPYFEAQQPDDTRPRQAIAAVRAWQRGELTVSQARAAAFAAHAAARETSGAAIFAARAAGQAAGVAHVPGHARHAAAYALKALAAAGREVEGERAWQEKRLAEIR